MVASLHCFDAADAAGDLVKCGADPTLPSHFIDPPGGGDTMVPEPANNVADAPLHRGPGVALFEDFRDRHFPRNPDQPRTELLGELACNLNAGSIGLANRQANHDGCDRHTSLRGKTLQAQSRPFAGRPS
jgi:hypothetical protein